MSTKIWNPGVIKSNIASYDTHFPAINGKQNIHSIWKKARLLPAIQTILHRQQVAFKVDSGRVTMYPLRAC